MHVSDRKRGIQLKIFCPAKLIFKASPPNHSYLQWVASLP